MKKKQAEEKEKESAEQSKHFLHFKTYIYNIKVLITKHIYEDRKEINNVKFLLFKFSLSPQTL